MIERRLNIDRIFQHKTDRHRLTMKLTHVPEPDLSTFLQELHAQEDGDDKKDPRERVYYGYFSLAGLSFFTASVHFILFLAVIVSASYLKKDLRPSQITQNINVWVPNLENLNIMFPVSRNLAQNVSLSETCKPFSPRTVQVNNELRTATIYPKILLFGEIDNRISIALFFLLSFAFQFFKVVNVRKFQDHPCKQEMWLGERFYDNIERGRVSKTHFVEYSISATLMMLVMITQIGITDLSLIINICVNTWACMVIGLLAEYIVDAEEFPDLYEQTFFGLHLSMIAHLLGWVPLLSAIFSMISPLATYKACIIGRVEIPSFVFVFVVGEILLFCSFGLVQFSSIRNAQRIRDETADKIQKFKNQMNADRERTLSLAKSNKMRTINKGKIDDITSHDLQQEIEEISNQENEKKRKDLVHNACSAEAWYISLSLFAKSFLALTIYIGINTQPG